MVLEIALFRVRPGVSDEQVLRLSDHLQTEVVELDGYLGRRLCKAADGEWADVVQWTSQEAARRAAETLEARACVQDFLRLEEPGSGRVLHLETMQTYPGGGRLTRAGRRPLPAPPRGRRSPPPPEATAHRRGPARRRRPPHATAYGGTERAVADA
jgi:hypothetical protein